MFGGSTSSNAPSRVVAAATIIGANAEFNPMLHGAPARNLTADADGCGAVTCPWGKVLQLYGGGYGLQPDSQMWVIPGTSGLSTQFGTITTMNQNFEEPSWEFREQDTLRITRVADMWALVDKVNDDGSNKDMSQLTIDDVLMAKKHTCAADAEAFNAIDGAWCDVRAQRQPLNMR